MAREVLIHTYNEITNKFKEISSGELVIMRKDIEVFKNKINEELKNRGVKNG